MSQAWDLAKYIAGRYPFSYAFLFSVRDKKRYENTKKNNFNQQAASKAPVCWPKYTTPNQTNLTKIDLKGNISLCQFYIRLSAQTTKLLSN